MGRKRNAGGSRRNSRDKGNKKRAETAKDIWLKDPSLLTRKGSIYFPNISQDNVVIPFFDNPGRPGYDSLTVYQIALVNAEWKAAKEMEAFMTPEEARAQFMEVFPDGEITCSQWDLTEAKRLLNNVYKAIINDTVINNDNLDAMSKNTRAALDALYKHIAPSKKHRVGLISHPELYAEALGIYDNDETFKAFKTLERCSFWNRRVEEYIAYGLPSVYLRWHLHGIEWSDEPSRDGCFLREDKSSYVSHRRVALSIPGLHFCVGYFGRRYDRRDGGWTPRTTRPTFSKIMSSNNENRDRLMQQVSRRKKSTCLVL